MSIHSEETRSMSANSDNSIPKGGQFLLEPVGSRPFFTPDHFTKDEISIGKTASDFMHKEVVPHVKELEAKNYELLMDVFRKGGELGLYMASVPEEYGGLGLKKAVAGLVTEKMASYGGFSVTYGAHVGIGTLPIVYFGTPEQKEKYLPNLALGKWMAAYALSEPGSGSDALGARCTAILSDDGSHYVVNGTKQWITNGAIAEVFTVFVQIQDPDGTHHFSALLVEKDTDGFEAGPEEHKLGIRGSSTTPLIFEDATIPVANLLGEKGRGHEIAFNILNVGRYTLGLGVTGGAKEALKGAIAYAGDRKQFKTPVIQFGALRQKVAVAACQIYAMETLGYRVAGLIDDMTESMDLGPSASGREKMKPIEEYAIEASVAKVYCSERLNEICSEALQMYGGYGYVEDYPIELAFRDARINMIFEGTNEINRLLIPDMLFKRAMKGRLPAMQWFGTLSSGPGTPGDGPLAAEADAVQRFKGTAGTLLQTAAMKYMQTLGDEQELVLLLSELVIDACVMDSVVGRSMQRHAEGRDTAISDAMARVLVADAADRVTANADALACAVMEGEELSKLRHKLSKWSWRSDVNRVADRKAIADATIEVGAYSL
jgi:alkylation response protein AidB-like acyl-CoA dehydrogenase